MSTFSDPVSRGLDLVGEIDLAPDYTEHTRIRVLRDPHQIGASFYLVTEANPDHLGHDLTAAQTAERLVTLTNNEQYRRRVLYAERDVPSEVRATLVHLVSLLAGARERLA